MHTEYHWADLETELSRAQGEGDYLSVSPLLLFGAIIGLFSLSLKGLTIWLRSTCGQTHTDINTLLWRTRRNPHDQSGRPGDTQSVGDERMDMAGVGVEGETHRGWGSEVHEKEGSGENDVWENMRADLVLRWRNGERQTSVKSRKSEVGGRTVRLIVYCCLAVIWNPPIFFLVWRSSKNINLCGQARLGIMQFVGLSIPVSLWKIWNL